MSESNGASVVGDHDGSGGGIDGRLGGGSIQSYATDDETVTHLLLGTDDGLQRETDDWQTTEEPGPDSGVVVLVTDRRVVFVVGNCRDPDVDGDYVRTVEHADIREATATDSLLSTTFAVTTGDGVSLAVTPSDTDGLDDLASFVNRARMQWRSARDFFDDFNEALIAVEEAVADGNPDRAERRRQAVDNDLAELGQTSSLHAVELPALEADCADARERLDHAMCRGYWHRARTLIERGDEARSDGDLTAGATGYRDACSAFRAMVDYGGPTETAFHEESLAMTLGPFDVERALLDRLADCRERASDGEADPATVWPALLRGYDHLRSALGIGGRRLDTESDTLAVALKTTREEAAEAFGNAIRAAEERGDDASGDGDGDRARDHYDTALELLDERASVTGKVDESVRERITEKRERTEWEWVGDR